MSRIKESILELVLETWMENDLPLLRRLQGDPRMMAFLGGVEFPEKIADRLQRYVQLQENGQDCMFKILIAGDLSEVGSIGYWEKDRRGDKVYETGWSNHPETQGRGIATEAVRMVIDMAKAERRHRFNHTFPSVDNLASNAICRKLGFSLIKSSEFDYPPRQTMQCNDWQFELFTNSY